MGALLCHLALFEMRLRSAITRHVLWALLDAFRAAIELFIAFAPAAALAYAAWWLAIGVKAVGEIVIALPPDHPQWVTVARYAQQHTQAVIVGTSAALGALMLDALRLVYQYAEWRDSH